MNRSDAAEAPDRGVAREVWRWLRPYRPAIAGSLGLLAVSVPLAQVHPLVWKFVVDNLIGRAGPCRVRDLRAALFARLAAQSLAWHRDRRAGDQATRGISDLDAMEASVWRELSDLLAEGLMFLIVAGVVLALQSVVGLTTRVPLLLSFVTIRVFKVRVAHMYEGLRSRLGDIQAFGREGAEAERFAGLARAYGAGNVRVLEGFRAPVAIRRPLEHSRFTFLKLRRTTGEGKPGVHRGASKNSWNNS